MNITRVDEETFAGALEVYTASWRESHKEICSPEFLRKRDCAGYLRGRMAGLYLVSDSGPVGVFRLTEAGAFGSVHPSGVSGQGLRPGLCGICTVKIQQAAADGAVES